MHTPTIRISGKDLGELALETFCPRCFWTKRQLAGKLPFQIFPGIFSSIDGYTKKFVHGWFDEFRTAPGWLSALGEFAGYIEPPHHSKFQYLDPSTGVQLTGAADAILKRASGAHVIADYKTAKYTATQDELLPMYQVQLNAYAVIAESLGIAPVEGLALIYCEPATEIADATSPAVRLPDGFAMAFRATVLPIDLEMDRIPGLLRTAKAIATEVRPPEGREACKNCANMALLLDLFAKA